MLLSNEYLKGTVHVDEQSRTVYMIQGYCFYACQMLEGFTEKVWKPIQETSTNRIQTLEDLACVRHSNLAIAMGTTLSRDVARKIAYEVRYQLVLEQKHITKRLFWAVFNRVFNEVLDNEGLL